MKVVSNDFLNQLKEFGREITAKIEYDDLEIESDSIVMLKFLFQTYLFKTTMTRVEVECDTELPVGVDITVKFGVLVGEEYEMVDMGVYKAIEQPTFNADTNSYTVMLYDGMIDTMTEYTGIAIEFPTTHKEFVEAIAERFGWTFTATEYPNYDTEIESDIYEGVGMSYRDVLEDLVVATMGNFIIKDDELKLIYPTDTGITLDEEYLNEVNVDFGEHYGPVNSLVLSRVETDNIYRQDTESIDKNGLTEIKVSDNMLLSREDRNNWIQAMFDKVNGLEYDIFEVSTIGIGMFEPLDLVEFNVRGETHKVLILNNEFTVTQGLSETMYNEIPDMSVIDYKIADTEDRVFRRAERLVDKQNLTITDLTQRVEGNEESLVKVTQTTENINAEFISITQELAERFAELGISFEEFMLQFGKRNGNNLIRNSAMKNGTEYWFKEAYILYAEQQTPPVDPPINRYWYVTDDYQNYRRGTIYQWDGTEWLETDKKRSDFDETFLKNFRPEENNESRRQTISNSIITVDSAMYDKPELTHNFGFTREIPLQENQEYLTLSIKINNQILSGNIHFGIGFAPDLLSTQPEEVITNELVEAIYEHWYCITPDEHRNMSEITTTVKIPKINDVISVTKTTVLLGTGYKFLVVYNDKSEIIKGTLHYRETENDDWENVSGIPVSDENGIIWTWRDFYSSYYQTHFTKENFQANYCAVFIAHYPGFNITIGNTLPEVGEYCSYYALIDDPNPNANIVYRAKWDGEFIEWVPTYIPSIVIQAMDLPSPPFPSNKAMPIAGYFQFADLKLEYGQEATLWSGHPEEIYGKNAKFDDTGLSMNSGQNKMFIDEDEIVSMYNEEIVFQITRELTKLKNLTADRASIAGLTIKPQIVDGDELIIIY